MLVEKKKNIFPAYVELRITKKELRKQLIYEALFSNS